MSDYSVSIIDMAEQEAQRVRTKVKDIVSADTGVPAEHILVDYCYYDTECAHFQTAFHWQLYDDDGVRTGSGAMQVPSELYKRLFEESLIPAERYEQMTLESFIALAQAIDAELGG